MKTEKELRDKFYKECTIDLKGVGGGILINTSPEELFKWFELEIKEQEIKILNDIKLTFDIYSDHSISCNGYKALCNKINQLNQK